MMMEDSTEMSSDSGSKTTETESWSIVEHFDWMVKSSPTIIVRWEYYRELSASDKTLRKIRF